MTDKICPRCGQQLDARDRVIADLLGEKRCNRCVVEEELPDLAAAFKRAGSPDPAANRPAPKRPDPPKRPIPDANGKY